MNRVYSIPSFCRLQTYDYDLERDVGADQPYLCEITSVMATLTEGQIHVNATQTHKSGEMKSRGKVKRLKTWRIRTPSLQYLKWKKIVGIKC